MPHNFAFVSTVAREPIPPSGTPLPFDPTQAAIEWDRWIEAAKTAAADPARQSLGRAMLAAAADPRVHSWLDALFATSAHLTRLILRDPQTLIDCLDQGPTITLAELFIRLNTEKELLPRARVMQHLRAIKRQAALVIGFADLFGLWPLDQVTGALSRLADLSLSYALCHLLREAAQNGQIALADPLMPERHCGIIILGMGKLGAHELNYSSDIDLIILFDPDIVRYTGRDHVQSLMARLARDLVKIFEERTADGYVFRTDLRLRPDPASTPPAVSVDAAEIYYGSLGQNWERAALIKARPVAGDLDAGGRFLAALSPFIWRKHLDFAAIADIHAIKRQIDARHGGSITTIAGHNLKLGHGGIREIEFFAQTQQLIWGGRIPALRRAGTCATLDALVDAGRIEAAVAHELQAAYGVLRRIEHRLQMIDDQQTHTIPLDPLGQDRVARLSGFADGAALGAVLLPVLARVQKHFRELFGASPALSDDGNLVFTGSEDDPDTLDTLARLGFRTPATVAATIRGWHHGRIRATRSARARELLTELIPNILRIVGRTADPDQAFVRFDGFLSGLPAGVQLFSLFLHHPDLLHLLGEIMGEAPHLAVQLARRPLLLDGVIAGDFYTTLPDDPAVAAHHLARDLAACLERTKDYEDLLNLTRRWANDRRFQIGVQVMQGRIDGTAAGIAFTATAETVIAATLPRVLERFADTHGTVAGGRFAVLGLGKLGSFEMNVLSDLDLIFIYDHAEGAEQSDGAKPLAVSTWFARLGQRLINALSAPTGDGELYEVDMRLRPSGTAGPIASSLESFRRYHAEQAWTWERMALTRARIVAGDGDLGREITHEIHRILTEPRDRTALLHDVADMRLRIAKAHPTPTAWDCKHRRGALVDIEFITQYLILAHGAAAPTLMTPRTGLALQHLMDQGFLSPDHGRTLAEGLRFWQGIQQTVRVCLGKADVTRPGDDPIAGDLIERALARALGGGGADQRHAQLETMAARILGVYQALIEEPATNT